MARTTAVIRDFRGRRWLIVALRAAHLVAVVGTGASLLMGQTFPAGATYRWTLVVSGVAMIAIDLWAAPGYLLEVAGSAMLAKLLLIAWLVLHPAHQLTLFWLLIVFSAVVAHAPAGLRHSRILGERPG
ncbi:MAG TPA: hypothetical protein PK440_13025 [Candidatus Accumulibacter phosphatis]|nr:MAG: hypothetical protein AW07_00223 [Candidatus Accumulibacter sp. SK-11]HCV12191.1 hypothetical protein [Accumulibacter sp.]HRL77469.1 hypothetical protein [Candidatus Accumulibacter phosphatis]HRQ95902.1 hypothetical protein [Candidatus Accumulibacter phosphatis]